MRDPDLQYSHEGGGYAITATDNVSQAASAAFAEFAKRVRWRPKSIDTPGNCVAMVFTQDDCAVVARLAVAPQDSFGRSHGMMIHAWVCGRTDHEIRGLLVELSVSAEVAKCLVGEVNTQPHGLPVLAGNVEMLDRPDSWRVAYNHNAMPTAFEEKMHSVAQPKPAPIQVLKKRDGCATARTTSTVRITIVALVSLLGGLVIGGGIVWRVIEHNMADDKHEFQQLRNEMSNIADELGVANTYQEIIGHIQNPSKKCSE